MTITKGEKVCQEKIMKHLEKTQKILNRRTNKIEAKITIQKIYSTYSKCYASEFLIHQ